MQVCEDLAIATWYWSEKVLFTNIQSKSKKVATLYQDDEVSS
jgi:hypothetical protein